MSHETRRNDWKEAIEIVRMIMSEDGMRGREIEKVEIEMIMEVVVVGMGARRIIVGTGTR